MEIQKLKNNQMVLFDSKDHSLSKGFLLPKVSP